MAGRNKSEAPARQGLANLQFVIREAVLQSVLHHLGEQLDFLKTFKSPNEEAQVYAATRKVNLERQFEALGRPPGIVIAEAKALYDQAKTLAKGGANVDAIAEQLSEAYPNIYRISPLLLRTDWGNMLVPRIQKLQESHQVRS